MEEGTHDQAFLNHLVGAFQRAIRLTNDFAIAYEPGPASALLAGIASRYSDVTFNLVHVHREPPARTAPPARALARRVGAHLLERLVSDAEWEAAKGSPVLIGIPSRAIDAAAGLLIQAREAALVTPRVLLPFGADALFDPAAEGLQEIEGRMDAIGKASRTQLRVPYRDRGMLHHATRLLEVDARLTTHLGQDQLFSRALGLLDLSTPKSKPGAAPPVP